jgi:hypothetical protein
MSRPSPIESAGAWYRVTRLGNECRVIFRDAHDRSHCRKPLGQRPARCGLRLREMGELAGGLDCATVSVATTRWSEHMAAD